MIKGMKARINSTYGKHDKEFFNELIRQANKGAQAVRLLRTYYPKQWSITLESGEVIAHGTEEILWCDEYRPVLEVDNVQN